MSGLNHEQNMKKMRLLTFMQLAETNPEMSFEMIQSELMIDVEEVESFIIDGETNSVFFFNLLIHDFFAHSYFTITQ